MAARGKKLINDPNDVVTQFIEGLAETYSGVQYLDGFPEIKVVLRSDVAVGTYDKVAGAAADAGLPLEEVAEQARHASKLVGTVGVALSVCTLPGQETSDRLGPEQIELGLGIHGEPGAAVTELQPVDVVVSRVLKQILLPETHYVPITRGDRAILLTNGLGATPIIELMIATRKAVRELQLEYGITTERVYTGSFMTSLDMQGFSLSVMKSDTAIIHCLDASTKAPCWPAGTNGPRRKPAKIAVPTPLSNAMKSDKASRPPATGDVVHASPPLLPGVGSADLVDNNDHAPCPSSPVSWRPAEEILPTEPEPGSPLHELAEGIRPTIVYTRRPRETTGQGTAATPLAPSTPAPSMDVQPAEDFIDKISKTLPPAVPVPVLQMLQQSRELTKEGCILETSIAAGAKEIIRIKDSLNEWDSKVGDGDCGTTMYKGAIAILDDMKKCYPMNDAAETVNEIGATIRRVMGGTTGILYDILCRAAYASLKGIKTVEGKHWANALQASIDAISRYGGARVGYRTMLDALIPASEILRERLEAGDNPLDAFLISSEAAITGAESTRHMQAQKGNMPDHSIEAVKIEPSTG
nr:unnamed protein product [Digitaria exilis]